MSNAKAVHDLQRIARELRGMDRRVDNMMPVWPRVGAMLSREVGRQFATKGAYMGTPWKPLAASTMVDRARRGHGRKGPLVRTSELKHSFTGRPMNIERYTPKRAEFGSSLKKAVWQQKGTHRNGKRHIPPRVMFKVTKHARGEIKKMIVKHIMKGR